MNGAFPSSRLQSWEPLSRFGDDSVGDVLGAFEQIDGWMHVPCECLRRVALLIRAPGVREEIEGLSCTVQLVASLAPALRSLQRLSSL